MTVEWWHIMLGVNLAFEVAAAIEMLKAFSVPTFGALMLLFLTCVLLLVFTRPSQTS